MRDVTNCIEYIHPDKLGEGSLFIGEKNAKALEARGYVPKASLRPTGKKATSPSSATPIDSDKGLLAIVGVFFAKYVAVGITSVEQLAAMDVDDLDAMPISRLGSVRAADHIAAARLAIAQ